MSSQNKKAIELIDGFIKECNGYDFAQPPAFRGIGMLNEIRLALSKDNRGGKFIGEKECPTCARESERFELTNYSPKYMCDGCGLTYGHIVGSWNLILKKILDNKKDENDF